MILKLINQNPGLYSSKTLRDCKGTSLLLESFYVSHVYSFKGTICLLSTLREDHGFGKKKKDMP